MLSPISFTSTYKVSSRNPESFKKFSNYVRYVEFNDLENKTKNVLSDKIEIDEEGEPKYINELKLIVPDSLDDNVEAYCNARGIFYKKYSNKPKTITSRIENAPENCRIAYVNAKKLEELIETQSSNFIACQNQYKQFEYKIDTMLKGGDKFPTTTLSIGALLNYEEINPENLKENEMLIDFGQRTKDPDHCIYFALKNLGLENIPVYVNDETYEIGSLLELFE